LRPHTRLATDPLSNFSSSPMIYLSSSILSPLLQPTHTAAPPEGRVDDARMCCQLLGLFFFIIFSLQKFFSFFSTYSFSLSPSPLYS
jgi:hypothetical protein